MIREKECKECGVVFSYQIKRGTDRRYCSPQCVKKTKKKRFKKKIEEKTYSECSVDGCCNQATRVKHGLCEMHFYRLRRTGGLSLRKLQYRVQSKRGYIRIREPDHPLADANNTVYEHRFVYHQHHGEGPFLCHWCGKIVTWFDMDVDHLDDDKSNNSPENLVASCPKCNRLRGQWKMIAQRRASGLQITLHGKTMCLSEWARKIGISASALKYRIESGWSTEDALTKPKGVTGPKSGCP